LIVAISIKRERF